MTSGDFSRLIDVSVVMSLSSMFIVLSAVILLVDRATSSGSGGDRDRGVSALLWAHVFYVMAAAALELGPVAAFGLSAGLTIAGTLGGLTFGYLGIRAVLETCAPRWSLLKTVAAVALIEGSLAILTGDIATVFVVSSLIHGTAAVVFARDLHRRAGRIGLEKAWLVSLPFAFVALAYFARLLLVGFGASGNLLVIASVGIGLVFPMATVYWVFIAMSLRGFHLTRAIERSAMMDALTGLGNRVALEQLQRTHQPPRQDRSGRGDACICFDLDHFKDINDTYGHSAGDAVLVAIARRLSDHAPSDGRSFRTGGDEFVLWRTWDEGTTLDDDCAVLHGALCRPVRFGEIELTVGVSMGIAISNGSVTPWDLIRRADIALYRSKDLGRNCVTTYSDDMGRAYDRHLATLAEFRVALAQGQIFAWFQPQIDAATGTLSGCEVLARWQHPERGVLAPEAFLPLARELGLMQALDREILGIAFHALEAWEARGLPVPRMSVNVSTERLRDPTLLADLRSYPQARLRKLSFELMETAFFDREPGRGWQIDALQDLGVRLEVDDFGAGTSSVRTTRALNPDRIKIDGCFVAGIENDASALAVLRAMVDLVRRMGARPVIEGVEAAAQLALVRQFGPIDVQGYAVARPMELESMTAWLTDGLSRSAEG